MSRWYFADAWYFIASLDRRDRHHPAATRLDDVVSSAAGVLTHDHHFRQEGFTVLSDAP